MDSGLAMKQRSRRPWRIAAWVGVAITLLSTLTGNWSDSLGYALATTGMFVSAREDFYAKRWTKIATLGLTVAAVVVWSVW